jgi:hypothetical protein
LLTELELFAAGTPDDGRNESGPPERPIPSPFRGQNAGSSSSRGALAHGQGEHAMPSFSTLILIVLCIAAIAFVASQFVSLF